MGITLLYISYYIVSLLYLVSGVLLLVHPKTIEHLIPSLFPLLAHFKLQRIANGINLIVIGVILVIVGNYIVEGSLSGFFIAFILSVWEIYLSVRFYWKRGETYNALLHFIIHGVLVLFIGWVILNFFSAQISESKSDLIFLSNITSSLK